MLITFTKEDNQGVQFLYNDVVILTLNVKNYDVHCILIDNGSSIDVLYYNTLQKIGISPNRLIQVNSPLVGFVGDVI